MVVSRLSANTSHLQVHTHLLTRPSILLMANTTFVDKKTRDRAMKSLTAFLSAESHQTLPPADMAKLWKGIFYCPSYSLFPPRVRGTNIRRLRLLDVGQTINPTGPRDRLGEYHHRHTLRRGIIGVPAWILGGDGPRVGGY